MDNIGIPRRPVSPDLVAGTFLWHLFIGTFLSSSAMLAEVPLAGRSFVGR
jgi:hypothetical protein